MGDEADISQAMDAVFIALGWRGRYQLFQIFQVMLCQFPAAFNILAIVFIGKDNEHKCKEASNSTSYAIPPDVTNVTYGTCSVSWVNVTGEDMEVTCPNDLEFTEPVELSLMSEWGLVCEKETLTDVSQTLLLAGMMVGATSFTALADRYGRKPFHIFCCLGLLATGIASAFVPTFAAFMPLRFFLGAFQQGMDLTSVTLGMEILPTEHRFLQGLLMNVLWAVAMVVLGFLAYLMHSFSWRYFQLLIALSSFYSFFMIWFLDESLRWLVANGKVDQAERILKKAAAQNQVSAQDVLTVFRTQALRQPSSEGLQQLKEEELAGTAQHQDSALRSSGSQEKEDLPTYGILDFFKHRHVLMCAAINGLMWCVNTMTYYGLSMTSVTLADDMYLGFCLSAVVEVPAVIIFFFAERCGRKKSCDAFHVLAGLSLLGSVTVSSLAGDTQAASIVVIVLSLLGKFAISASFALIFLYTPEQFPTNLRNASIGMASMAGRVGGMIAPYSRTLIRHYPWVPGTIFGVCCLLLPLFMRMLPETCGRELPQTIEQMEVYISAPYKVDPRWKKKEEEEEAAEEEQTELASLRR